MHHQLRPERNKRASKRPTKLRRPGIRKRRNHRDEDKTWQIVKEKRTTSEDAEDATSFTTHHTRIQ